MDELNTILRIEDNSLIELRYDGYDEITIWVFDENKKSSYITFSWPEEFNQFIQWLKIFENRITEAERGKPLSRNNVEKKTAIQYTHPFGIKEQGSRSIISVPILLPEPDAKNSTIIKCKQCGEPLTEWNRYQENRVICTKCGCVYYW